MITTEALIAKFEQALKEKWGYIWGTAGEKWTEALQKALEKTTDSDRAQGRKYGSKWIGHTVADCSGLFSWAFRKLGSTMYHGSDTMYRKWCTDHGEMKKGKRVDGRTLKPGTAVFVWNGKKYSHVGLFVGGEKVIEAMGTIQGVTTSKVTASKWTHWGELKGVTYDGVQPAPEPTPSLPTIKKGSKGEYVKKAQTILLKLGYDIGSYGIDSDFGKATEAAVKAFQKDHKLTSDGVIGAKTWEALEKANEQISTTPVQKLYTVSIPHLDKTQATAIMNNYPGSTMKEES
ncbi:MAG: peptidoglycan-binding protein [Lachnospiraceae bacterium]|nr:peptidoglycan-binding protein [Lachnospiraceae bacterium]MBP5462498.1 peptidoglycan-binding protein [Lachnospiraceae bacterium]